MDSIKTLRDQANRLRQTAGEKRKEFDKVTLNAAQQSVAGEFAKAVSDEHVATNLNAQASELEKQASGVEQKIVELEGKLVELAKQEAALREEHQAQLARLEQDMKQRMDDLERQRLALQG